MSKREGAAAPLSTSTWRQKDGAVVALRDMTASHVYYAIRMLERRAATVPIPVRQSRLGLLYRERDRREKPKGWKTKFYVPRGGLFVPVKLDEWAEWFETSKDRRLAFTTVAGQHPNAPTFGVSVEVCTTCLGIDLNYGGVDDGVPILWETLVFGGVRDRWTNRYRSQAEAIIQHAAIVSIVRDAEKKALVAAKQAALPVGVDQIVTPVQLDVERVIVLGPDDPD